MSLDWMWQETEKEEGEPIRLSEGGEFTSAYAGLWNVAVVWRMWDSSGLDVREMGYKPDSAQSYESGSFYYFRNENYEQAVKLSKELGQRFGPKQVWRWEMPTSEWIGAPNDALEKFGELITQESGVGGYGGRDRDEFHMITLPSVVQSLAVATGMIKEEIYDYSKLSVQDGVLTDDYQHRMLGSDDSWEDSELWKARKAIWAALGEENARAYTIEQGNTKHDATSKNLIAALRVLYRPQTSLYARVMRVPHPHVERVSKEKRLRVMAVTAVWKDAAEARAAEDAEDSHVASETPKAEVKSNGNGLSVPARWSGSSEADWLDWLKDFLHSNSLSGKPKPIVMKALKGMEEDLDSNYLTTPDEIEPWLEKANE